MDSEILQDYLVEARELLEKAQAETLRLEAEADDPEVLASLFRAFHTIKGGASFLEATNLVVWAHELETLLDNLRSRVLPVTSARIDAILRGLDVIDGMLQELAREQNPAPGPADLGQVIQRLAVPRPAESDLSSDARRSPITTAETGAQPAGVTSELDPPGASATRDEKNSLPDASVHAEVEAAAAPLTVERQPANSNGGAQPERLPKLSRTRCASMPVAWTR